jgi:AraC family transcriptional regulator, regulatory protein of adaptative response / DNA-3-methyladenine glycosylase II
VLPGSDDHLLLRAHLPHWRELIHIVERARRIASLDLDPDEPARRLGDDPIIGPLLHARPGVRPPGTWDPFETGVRAILGQQVTLAAANTIAGRLVQRLGRPVAGLAELGLTHVFPSPEALAEADLSGLGIPRAREEAIRSFARAVAGDAIRLDRSVSLERLVSSITAVDGLGPWTAHYLALRLGERDAYPTTDLGLQRALRRRVDRSVKALDELAERWRPWRALAATHLWLDDSAGRRPVARVDAA